MRLLHSLNSLLSYSGSYYVNPTKDIYTLYKILNLLPTSDDPIIVTDAQYGENGESIASWWRFFMNTPKWWRDQYLQKLTPYISNPNSSHDVAAWVIDPRGIGKLGVYCASKGIHFDLNIEIRQDYNDVRSYEGFANMENDYHAYHFPSCCGASIVDEIWYMPEFLDAINGDTWIHECIGDYERDDYENMLAEREEGEEVEYWKPEIYYWDVAFVVFSEHRKSKKWKRLLSELKKHGIRHWKSKWINDMRYIAVQHGDEDD